MTVTTTADALDLGAYLRKGDRIVWGQACGEPTTLVEALIAQAESIGELSAFAATSFSGLLDAAAAERINLSSMGAIGAFCGCPVRFMLWRSRPRVVTASRQ